MLCGVKGQVIAQQTRGILSKIPPSNKTTRNDTLGYQATNEKAPLQILHDEGETQTGGLVKGSSVVCNADSWDD